MNKAQKEIQQAHLDEEKRIIQQLKLVYGQAQDDCINKIIDLSRRTDMENLQSIIYQKQYQEALKKQLDGVLDNLQSEEFTSIADYLQKSYHNGYVGVMYDLHQQGIPIIMPINQEQVVKALQTDSKLSKGLYDRLGEDVGYLKRSIRAELSRGIANGSTWNQMAVHIAKGMNSPFKKAINNAIRISRTEGHRIQQRSALDAQYAAKEKGADIVKQWDSTLDNRTRPHHRQLDGQIRELDEPFEVDGMKADAPGHFGKPKEDCNCRCCLLQRARWALGEDELDELKERVAYFGLDKTKDFEEFKQKYLKLPENAKEVVIKTKEDLIKELSSKGIVVNIGGAGKFEQEAVESIKHLNILVDEYDSTVVSYNVGKLHGSVTEMGSAYMMNGKTSITIAPLGFKINKATDTLGLGEKQPLGITYHEFAHTLSQSREKIDVKFWKEIRKLKKEYEGNRGSSNWFDIKISDYASKDVDEFIAESFAQAKLAENPSEYSVKVLSVIDKYFKK